MNVFVITIIIGMVFVFALLAALAIGAVMLAEMIARRRKEERHEEATSEEHHPHDL